MSSYENKTIRAPSLKRGKTDGRLSDRIKLKKVLGLTVCSNAALDVVPNTGVIVYPAGCATVFFNAKKQTQSYILNTSKKAITAIAISSCGRYLATGECGINPAIKVWELDHTNENNLGTLLAEFLGHKYAISCIAFSPTAKYLVSVGSQHDMIINVFEWKANLKKASNKVSAKVSAVSFNNDGNYFVTVGNRHVKYWYLERNHKLKEPIPLMGRSAILGELRNNDFCAVACGKGECSGSTYAITRVGHLVEFNSRRLLDKYVACRTNSANCISVNSNYILVGCADAIIRIFHSVTLEYITTLPRTHYLGVDVAQGTHINHIMAAPNSAKYPDTIAMVFDETRSKVICVYNDHSLYIWDLRDVKRVGKSQSFLYHSACIWGVETVPCNIDVDVKSEILPEDSFLTCSSDDTIRVWGLEGCQNNDIYRKNIYSKELLKVLYIDNELNYIRDNDNPILNTDKSSSYDGRNGVRCIKLSPYKDHLATGDRSGNIRIYSLSYLNLITMIEAHDSEVLCLEYTNGKFDRKFLASASRDRLIHVFNVDQDYQIVQTLDDHSSSITSVKFVCIDGNLQMISCGADKSIMFRYFQGDQFVRGINCSGKATLYDMEIDSNSKHVLTACQDRFIRIYGTQNAKHTKTFKGSYSLDGSLIKLCLDPSGIYVATSCTDKTLAVFDYYSTECMAKMYGHSELVTGLRFSNDCQYLISASGDGCIFIWQMPHDMVVTMQARLSQQRLRSGHQAAARNISSPIVEISSDIQIEKDMLYFDTESPGYKFSEVGQLPLWAKRKTSATDSQINFPNLSTSPNQNLGVAKPRGRWAQRGQIEPDTLTHRSNSESPISVNFHQVQTSDYNSGSSKEVFFNQSHYLSEDSSIDSGLDAKKEIFNKNKLSLGGDINKISKLEPNNEHDGDVEDISDGERTSSDHGLFYPTQLQASPMDFKVNAMNEDELRKSVRKQKFEKVKLNLSGLAPPIITTGTSDTEDEGSTPSGDNAERSLGSTLGGSFESIPQQLPSNFLQAALDGPGHLNDRSDRNRRSISAKHNIENKNNLPKSYTNSKKEELMKVINDAKQKLETVGYRSNLRGSQSISDLSHFTNLDSAKASRIVKQGAYNAAFNHSEYNHNCNVVNKSKTIDPFNKSMLYCGDTTIKPPTLNICSTPQIIEDNPDIMRPIFKHYSCPVSPVHEEYENENTDIVKRHSMFSYDAKTIIDTIHSDTEKMIEEIELKYGDLNPKYPIIKPTFNTQSTNKEDDGNFSSDSLEDCSLNLIGNNTQNTNKVCKKHNTRSLTHSVSEFCLTDTTNQTIYRNISLSDILNYDDKCSEQTYTDNKLATSPSFFLSLNPRKKSQESLLSDELNMSNFNSMESILSDESDCKSAPLEVLFNYCKKDEKHYKIDNSSKSYGSSPNSITTFDKYMKENLHLSEYPTSIPNNKSINYPNKTETNCGGVVVRQHVPKDDIPLSKQKNCQYLCDVKKSLSKEFSNQRQQNTFMSGCNDTDLDYLFQRKSVKPAAANPIDDKNHQNFYNNMKKSCSYDISLSVSEKNKSEILVLPRTLELNYVPHKPPVANRRSSSMRSKSRSKNRERYNTVDQISVTAFEKRDFVNEELTVDCQIKKHEILPTTGLSNIKKFNEKLHLYSKQDDEHNLLDDIDISKSCGHHNSIILQQFNYQEIHKKIGTVNKLLELEERRLRNETLQKEIKLMPFECDSNQIGYVKSLTMNFDKLAKGIEDEIEYERSRNIRMKRNHSLPDVLEGAKFSTYKIFDKFGFDKGNARASKLLSVEDSSIRRACSLSDLCLAKGTGSIGQQPSPKVSQPARTNGPPRTFRKNSFQNIKSSNGMHGRSFSVGILHQASDSETDPQMYRSNGSKLTTTSRHSSGTGPSRLNSNKSSNPILPRRKGLQSSYSSVNLSTTHHDDSSSEEVSSGPTTYKSGKPSVPPRPKNLVPDNRLLPTNISNITKIRGTIDSINQSQTESPDTKITPQMCSNIITMLNTTANAVLQLHTRLKNNKESTISRNNNSMIIELENAAVMTKNMLTNMTESKEFEHNSSVASNSQLLSDGQSTVENGDYVLMLSECVEIIKELGKLRVENNKFSEYDENN